MPWSPWATWPRAQAIDLASHDGVPCGPVNNLAQTFENAQVKHRGLRMELDMDAATLQRLHEAGLVYGRVALALSPLACRFTSAPGVRSEALAGVAQMVCVANHGVGVTTMVWARGSVACANSLQHPGAATRHARVGGRGQ